MSSTRIIALAQANAVAGDIASNVAHHLELVTLALQHGAQLIVFPELSLTGYEPELAARLALEGGQPALSSLQRASDESGATILVGAPSRSGDETKPRISVLALTPGSAPTCYSKQYLHADEQPFFNPGPIAPNILGLGNDKSSSAGPSLRVGLAICFELGVPAHAAAAFDAGAEVYIASVAKNADGMALAEATLAGELRLLPTSLVH
jgi:predicted amidohydrolase